MTDNENIKALEEIKKGCWANGDFYTVIENAVDLINRQKAEIERLRDGISGTHSVIPDLIKQVKSKAIKEFAERVQSEIECALKNNYEVRGQRMAKLGVGETDQFVAQCTGKIYALRGIDDFIDDLVKEMVGDDYD